MCVGLWEGSLGGGTLLSGLRVSPQGITLRLGIASEHSISAFSFSTKRTAKFQSSPSFLYRSLFISEEAQTSTMG